MKDLSFFVRLLGQNNKVEEILEEYVLKNYKANQPVEKRTYNKKKKKFKNGMFKWDEQSTQGMLNSLNTLTRQGLSRNSAFNTVGKQLGITGGAVYQHWP